MDGMVLHLAQRLQNKLAVIDGQRERDTLVWAHGFLTGILKNIESRLPELMNSKTILQSTQAALEEVNRRVRDGRLDDTDSLEQIERELDGSDDVLVPAKRKPGPKGRSGGTALPLPESDPPM